MAKHDSKSKSTSKHESQTYQSMLNELEEIVREVSQGKLDLDEIVGKIEHGYGLISTMRHRLDQTRATVEKMRTDFERGDGSETKKSGKRDQAQEKETESASEDDDLPF